MELEFLKSFIVIARMQSITLAAEKLNISQSALSNGLMRLEQEVGARLFDRTNRGLTLTGRGAYFLKWAEENADFGTRLRSRLDDSASKSGVIRIGTAIESDTLFILLSVLKRKYPQIKVELYGARSLPENYTMTDMDAFVVSEKDKRDLPGIMLANRRYLMVLMRESHPLADRESLTLDDIRDQTFVFSSEDGQPEWTYEYCRKHGLEPEVQFLCEDYDGKMDITAHSDALAIGYNTMRLLRESMKGIRAVPLATGEEFRESFHLVWRKDPVNPLVRPLIELAYELERLGRDSFMEAYTV